MDKSLIKKYNFESAKNQIKRFSKELPSAPTIDRVKVDAGPFGLFDYNVTGIEFNDRIGKVQSGFIDINQSLHNVIKEFGAVYNTLDVLDKEYISGIITTMEDLEKTCKKVENAQSDIKNTQYDLKNTQVDLKNNVDNLKKTVEKLVILKNTVERIDKAVSAKLLSFDEITTKLDKSYKVKQIPSIINNISTLQSKVTSLNSSLSSLSTELNKHKHNFEKSLDNFIENVHQTNERIDKDIKGFQQYRTSLESYKHLRDVDAIWDNVEKHNANLTGLHKQVDDFISEVRVTEKEIKESIQRIESKISAQSIYEKKIKIAYWIAGGAIALSVTNIVLQLLGIL